MSSPDDHGNARRLVTNVEDISHRPQAVQTCGYKRLEQPTGLEIEMPMAAPSPSSLSSFVDHMVTPQQQEPRPLDMEMNKMSKSEGRVLRPHEIKPHERGNGARTTP